MLKSVVAYALVFATLGAGYGLVKTGLAGDGLSVDPGLIVVMAIVGGLGQFFSWRRSHSK